MYTVQYWTHYTRVQDKVTVFVSRVQEHVQNTLDIILEKSPRYYVNIGSVLGRTAYTGSQGLFMNQVHSQEVEFFFM